MTHFTIQPLRLHWHPLLLNRPTTLTALDQPYILDFTVPRFYDFANSQKTRKLLITSLLIDISYFHQTPLHFNDAFHNPTFTPPLAPSSPQPPHNPHGS